MTVYGFDGSAYGVGDRVEIHPGTDLWMRGARFGVVVGLRITPKDRVHVRMDRIPGKVAGSADTFRLVESCVPWAREEEL
jgi:hypothetical protein